MTLNVSPNSPATSAQYNALVPVIARKTVAQSVASSVALVDVTQLVIVLTEGVWQVELRATVSGATAGDVRLAWTNTGTMSVPSARSCVGPAEAATDLAAATMRCQASVPLATEVVYGTVAAQAASITETFWMTVTSAGSLQLQFAQGTSNVTNTSINVGSTIVARRID